MLLFISCGDDNSPNDPSNPDGLTITISQDFLGSGFSGWLVISDIEGYPVKTIRLVNGSINEFEDLNDEKYHISYFTKYYYADEDYFSYNGNTILNVKRDQPYTLGLKNIYQSPSQGEKFNVNISFNSFQSKGYLSSGTGVYASSFLHNLNQIGISMGLIDGEEKYLVVASEKDGTLKYDFLNNPKAEESYSFDISGMKSFDKYITIPSENPFYLFTKTTSMIEENGYFRPGYIVSYNPTNSSFPKTLAYLNDFEVYKTEIIASIPSSNKNYFYNKLGDIPSSIEFPYELDFSVHSKKYSDFKISLSEEINYYTAGFSKYKNSNRIGENFRWFFFGNVEYFGIQIPQEVQNDMPFLVDLETLELDLVSAVKSSYDYETSIRNSYVEIPKTFKYELRAVQQNNF